MRHTTLIILFFALSLSLFAQNKPTNEYAAVDNKALQLPDSMSRTTSGISKYITENFSTDKDKVRAIFIWVASNIQYDVENMFAIDFFETTQDKITKPLRSRKGICENYALLFNDICSKSGIKSYVVDGYVKQNGLVVSLSHAWCAALIGGTWFLYDPTWGSGYVKDGRFVKKINNDYYQVNPSVLIKTHMPFDYQWQFLNYPLSNQDFYDGKTQQNTAKPFFNYADSIKLYETLSHIEMLKATARRIEANGVKSPMIYERLKNVRIEIENDRIQKDNIRIENENARQSVIVGLYNQAVTDFNEGIHALNAFTEYRNKQFVPIRPDPEIQGMLDASDKNLKKAVSNLNGISHPDADIALMAKQLQASINDAAAQLQEQQTWLKAYFSKGKVARKSMFYKVTMFGMPVK